MKNSNLIVSINQYQLNQTLTSANNGQCVYCSNQIYFKRYKVSVLFHSMIKGSTITEINQEIIELESLAYCPENKG